MSGVLCHPLRAKKAIISVSALEFGSVSFPPSLPRMIDWFASNEIFMHMHRTVGF